MKGLGARKTTVMGSGCSPRQQGGWEAAPQLRPGPLVPNFQQDLEMLDY